MCAHIGKLGKVLRRYNRCTVATEIMFPCEVRTSRTSNEVDSMFVRSSLEVRSKLGRSSFEVEAKFVLSWLKVRSKLRRSLFEVGPSSYKVDSKCI